MIKHILHRSPKARHLGLTVHPDGKVVLTLPVHATLAEGEEFLRRKAGWVAKKVAEAEKRRERDAGKVVLKSSKREYARMKEAARALVLARLEVWNALDHFKFKFGRVSIKNQRSRWGSCSAKGNLNFNYKLALLPLELADYVVVHELCHLKEMNHGPKFWKLVEKGMPDWRERRKELTEKYVNVG